MIEYGKIIVKGFMVGGSMLVPGVSGGSMAMILGIYDTLIDAVSTLVHNFVRNLKILVVFALSAGVGMVLVAKPLLQLIERFPNVMLYFFMGAVFGSIPMIYRKSKVGKIRFQTFLYPFLGLLMMWGIASLPSDLLKSPNSGSIFSYLPMLIAGVVIAIALVLPGISVSYMLLVLGVYEDTMRAISTLDVQYLLPLGIGLILGIILTTKILDFVMKKYPVPTYLIILGFILASLAEIYPGIPSGIDLLLAILMFLTGAILIYKISESED